MIDQPLAWCGLPDASLGVCGGPGPSPHGDRGDELQKVASSTEIHRTPWGNEQQFVCRYYRLSI